MYKIFKTTWHIDRAISAKDSKIGKISKLALHLKVNAVWIE